MPFGGNDCLALTAESPLEPELPIRDHHHHFWDFRAARIPYRRYLLHEPAADITSGHNVRSTVFVEARGMYRADGPKDCHDAARHWARHFSLPAHLAGQRCSPARRSSRSTCGLES